VEELERHGNLAVVSGAALTGWRIGTGKRDHPAVVEMAVSSVVQISCGGGISESLKRVSLVDLSQSSVTILDGEPDNILSGVPK
jgi:hypothetical protein